MKLNLQVNDGSLARDVSGRKAKYTGWLEINGGALPVVFCDSLDDFEHYMGREGHTGWRVRPIPADMRIYRMQRREDI